MSGIEKKNAVFIFIPECSLSYPKITQMSGIEKKNAVFIFIPECSLSYSSFSSSFPTAERLRWIARGWAKRFPGVRVHRWNYSFYPVGVAARHSSGIDNLVEQRFLDDECRISAIVSPEPLRGNMNKLTDKPLFPGFRWCSTPGYLPQPLRGWYSFARNDITDEWFYLSKTYRLEKLELSYLKIMQMSGIEKKNAVFIFIPECSLSYLKIMQMSGIEKKNCRFIGIFFFFN